MIPDAKNPDPSIRVLLFSAIVRTEREGRNGLVGRQNSGPILIRCSIPGHFHQKVPSSSSFRFQGWSMCNTIALPSVELLCGQDVAHFPQYGGAIRVGNDIALLFSVARCTFFLAGLLHPFHALQLIGGEHQTGPNIGAALQEAELERSACQRITNALRIGTERH